MALAQLFLAIAVNLPKRQTHYILNYMYVIRIMVRLWSTRTTHTHVIAFWLGRHRTSLDTSRLLNCMYWNKNIDSQTPTSVCFDPV